MNVPPACLPACSPKYTVNCMSNHRKRSLPAKAGMPNADVLFQPNTMILVADVILLAAGHCRAKTRCTVCATVSAGTTSRAALVHTAHLHNQVHHQCASLATVRLRLHRRHRHHRHRHRHHHHRHRRHPLVHHQLGRSSTTGWTSFQQETWRCSTRCATRAVDSARSRDNRPGTTPLHRAIQTPRQQTATSWPSSSMTDATRLSIRTLTLGS